MSIATTGFNTESFEAFLAARDEPPWLTESPPGGVEAV